MRFIFAALRSRSAYDFILRANGFGGNEGINPEMDVRSEQKFRYNSFYQYFIPEFINFIKFSQDLFVIFRNILAKYYIYPIFNDTSLTKKNRQGDVNNLHIILSSTVHFNWNTNCHFHRIRSRRIIGQQNAIGEPYLSFKPY